MANRKDNKGRVLKTGESQRPNGGYEFRYFDAHKKRHSVYASTLNELREKEATIHELYAQGTNYAEGSATVLELVKRYLETKDGLSYNTQRSYEYVLEKITKSPLANKRIRDVKTSDAKRWLSSLSKSGLGYWSINQVKGVISPAFDLAVEDEIIGKNPFAFSLGKIIPVNTKTREALNYQQQKALLKAFSDHPSYSSRYDLISIMLGTGLRVGEVTGLTFDDIDMDKRCINVSHQLIYNYKRGLYVAPPKSDTGCRVIPMSDFVFERFQSAIQNRRFVADEPVIDDCSGFIFLTKRGTPDYESLIQTAISAVVRDYNRTSSEQLPHISPHVLRHTFCTNLINSGVSVKQVQYLMGHATANITMNVYAHAVQDKSNEGLLVSMNEVNKAIA